MQSLYEMFPDVKGTNEFELFKDFFDSNLHVLKNWLLNRFKIQTNLKSDVESNEFRKLGNVSYSKRMWQESIELYTKALSRAVYNSEAYGSALGNRSAVSFAIQEYKNCLKDIELCLKSEYPDEFRAKIYIRKCECLHNMGVDCLVINRSVQEAVQLIESGNLSDAKKYEFTQKLLNFTKLPRRICCVIDKPLSLPNLKDGENEMFLHASSSISFKRDSKKGRHVVANCNLKAGDVLFVEPAFAFAPVFAENGEFHQNKCYNCLSDVICCIPCKTCTLCLYCNETCRDSSWEEFHQWECKGMTVNLWYDMGIALPALRALLKGVRCGFVELSDVDKDVERFGKKVDNYVYFNDLMGNIEKMETVTPFLILSSLTVLYLKYYTFFFKWLSDENIKPAYANLVISMGGLLTRHMAQISCNSSLITHWIKNEAGPLPTNQLQLACGMYPSVSIMNHSCKPNITTYFVRNYIVVKALTDILDKEEILNCYGADYRYMNREERQSVLRTTYMFECNCQICCDPSLEIEQFDSYVCTGCKGPIFKNFVEKCVCGLKVDRMCLQQLERLAKGFINTDDRRKNLNYIDKCYEVRKKILNENHTDIDECLNLYRLCYLNVGDIRRSLDYLSGSVILLQKRIGKNSLTESRKLVDSLLDIFYYFKTIGLEKIWKFRNFVEELELIYKKAKEISLLYYDDDQIDFYKFEQNFSYILETSSLSKCVKSNEDSGNE